MTTYDYENAYVSFKWLVWQAATWTNDHRQLSKLSKVVYDTLLKYKTYDQDDHSVHMTSSQRDNTVDCLRIVYDAACQSDYDKLSLTSEAVNILATLNVLFVKEGLAPVTELHKHS